MSSRKGKANRFKDYKARDYESILHSLHEMAPQLLPEWKDYKNESDFGNVLLQLFAHVGDIMSYYQDRVVNESFLSTAVERKSVIEHLRLIGYQLATATPAATELMVLIPSEVTDTFSIKAGDAFSTKKNRDSNSVRFEYTGADISIDADSLLVDPRFNTEDGLTFKSYPIVVEEGRLIKEEVIGISNGEEYQRFPLVFKNLILRSRASNESRSDIRIWYETDSFRSSDWVLQESLAFSQDDAQEFSIEINDDEQATVLFGGEGFGAIPPAGASIKASYRVGGGTKGNVAPGTIISISDAPALSALSAKVVNVDKASGGAERESIVQAIKQGPGVFRSQRRAVTAADYRNLALNFPGVGKVIAESAGWNRVTLFVAPQGGGKVSDVLRENLLAYFEDKRPISTVITVEDVDYLKIYIGARIGIEGYYPVETIRKQVYEAVTNLFSFDNIDFKQTLYLSKVYEVIEAIEGVKYVFIDQFERQARANEGRTARDASEQNGRIELASNELARIPGTFGTDPVSDRAFRRGLQLTIEGVEE